MSVTSDRSVVLQFTGDVEYQQNFDASTGATSPGEIKITDLTTGNNTITVPDDAIAVTIVKPSGNTVVLTLKGVNGDTGILLSLTDPDSISLNGSVTSFVINVASAVTLRFIFT